MTGKNEIVLFESRDGAVSLPVSVDSDTVWLSQAQMAQLFGKDKTVIFRHMKNAIADGEIDPKVTSAKFAMVTPHGAIAGKTQPDSGLRMLPMWKCCQCQIQLPMGKK